MNTNVSCKSVMSAVINHPQRVFFFLTQMLSLFQAQCVRFTAGHGDKEKVLQHMQELVQEIHLWQGGVSHPSLFTLDTLCFSRVSARDLVRGQRSLWNSACGSKGEGGSWWWWITLIRLVRCCRACSVKSMKQRHLKLFCTLHIDQFCCLFFVLY